MSPRVGPPRTDFTLRFPSSVPRLIVLIQLHCLQWVILVTPMSVLRPLLHVLSAAVRQIRRNPDRPLGLGTLAESVRRENRGLSHLALGRSMAAGRTDVNVRPGGLSRHGTAESQEGDVFFGEVAPRPDSLRLRRADGHVEAPTMVEAHGAVDGALTPGAHRQR